MGIRLFFLYCILFLSLHPSCNLPSSGYREETTSLGNIITGLEKEEAIEKFGFPASATNEVWQYLSPKNFFVYFPPANISFIHIYPESCEVGVDFPLEYKVFAYLPDFKINDVTSSVKLTINEAQSFVLEKPGIIVPKKTGEFQIVAKYKDVFSNPLYLSVKASGEKQVTQEQLLSINVLPYQPKITPPPGNKVEFVALGTYFKPQDNTYIIKDISDDVEWFTFGPRGVADEPDRKITFTALGKTKVFCRFNNLESDRQEVEVKETISSSKGKVKHITLLPEFVIMSSGNTVNFVAIASYDDWIKDVTSIVSWKIENPKILNKQEKGFFLRSPGVTQLIAGLDNIDSSSAKVISLEPGDYKNGSFVRLLGLQENKKTNEGKEALNTYNDLAENINNVVEKISDDSIKENKKFALIKIIPENFKIPLGEKKRLFASGVYNDNSEIDLTLLGEWVSSDIEIATVTLGIVSAVSPGEGKIHFKFRGIESLPASVIVEKPKLISIIISPQDSQITMEDRLDLKAQGYFSDSSIQDISNSVSWIVANPDTVKIEKGVAWPLWIGETQAHAEYSGVKSLPIKVKVIFTIPWLLGKIFTIILFLILCVSILLFTLYFVVKNKEKKLLSYSKSPQEFIINLYSNLKEILNIFGNKSQLVIAPLSYAELIEKRYSINNNLFLKLTKKFIEAKYSTHLLGPDDINSALNDYNNFLKEVISNYNKLFFFFKYCSTLLKRIPLSIYYGVQPKQKK